MLQPSYDTEAIKARVDLVELAGRYTTLRKWSMREWAGPCPRGACTAKTDGFHVHDDGWFTCYSCREGKHGDAIEFVRWLGLAPDFGAACDWLDGAPMPTPAQPVTPRPKPKDTTWHDDAWQAEARATLARARAVLDSPAGEPGRAYLAGRGLTPETWRAWGLGYDPAKWAGKDRTRPAVVMPWANDTRIMAVKYRYADRDEPRFTQKRGGQQIAFGLQMMTGAQTLWLTEGELNALSVWQALRGVGRVDDVLSFGGEGKATHLDQVVIDRAGRYARVIVWADKADMAAAAMQAIPGACGLRSLVIEGRKLDANELLQAGALTGFVLAAWERMTQPAAPAALPVIQAENKAPAPDLAAVEAALRARIVDAEDRIARGETLLQTETDPVRAARYRARLAELTDQVNACYDQIGALPIDWPFPG